MQLTDVTKEYDGQVVLNAVNLSVSTGENLAVVGPSGSGKTTLLLMLAGAIKPSSGQIVLHGEDIGAIQPGRELSRLVGMIHQQFDLVSNLSALNNVLAGRLGIWSLWQALFSLIKTQDRVLGLEALNRVGIVDRAQLRAGMLSGGEQQRVAIARLLVQNPLLVLADEPVSSLDPARADEVIRLLIEVARSDGKTLITSLHSVDLARKHYGRVVGLRNGNVQFDTPAKHVTAKMLRNLYALEGLRSETLKN